ncbi:hypothetical protein IHE56_06865 [Streptomyces sp. ID01-12c]|uniref:hypothetical protein n=1 Tax=Streptomyces caniscabiei TaxID=2746961 RepID=UPI0017868B4A|nr:hypothetical protein [Streptomyces caniscabiei]MBD9701816.1 hypothetical protein [Streptomyces caniscabiei]MDX3728641.1 hypothetical protein [Streptomyces caniscabiei]
MTSATPLPGAGAALRGAVGCRLVRVALLLSGLFVLGVLCGERANAADGAPTSPPPLTAVTHQALRPATGHTARPVTDHAARPVTETAVQPVPQQAVRRSVAEEALEPVVGKVVRPVFEKVVRPVTTSVVRPVTDGAAVPVTESVVVPVEDLVESVTEGLGGVTSQLPSVSLPSLPGVVPGLPDVPQSPELPNLPGLPGVPGWSTLPVESLPVGEGPQESRPTEVEKPDQVPDGDGGRDIGRDTARVSRPVAGPVPVAYGPIVVGGGAVAVPAPHRTAAAADADAGAGDQPGVRAPARQSQDGIPTGALGRHSAVDNGGPRHAESHALAALPHTPLSLVPGAPVTDAAGGTRERHREVPVFPG